MVDSAFACFWWILRRGLAHYQQGKSLRPRLENPQNHRKILESFMSFLPSKTLGETPSRHCEGAKRPKQSTRKVDSSMDPHADKSARDDRENRFCVKKILRIAVGLWLFYTIFGAELDLGSAVASKIV